MTTAGTLSAAPLIERTRALAELPDGWDGDGAKAIDNSLIDAVCRHLLGLADHHGEALLDPDSEGGWFAPHCGARSSGAVQLEWHVGERILELEFETRETIRYLKWWPNHPVADEEADYPADDLERSAALLHWVRSGDDTPR